MDLWCWSAGPILNKEQLSLWCQDQPGFDAEVFATLGTVAYAHKLLDQDPGSPDLIWLHDSGESKALFLCHSRITLPNAPQPDLSPNALIQKMMKRYVQTARVRLETLRYWQILWPPGVPFPHGVQKRVNKLFANLEKRGIENSQAQISSETKSQP
ncbi:hypothetical protein BT96DRAFT_1009840 [Gymnopus androsaceus JB14]|uniref:Uncharacterized protein n=1 Tax=Gymnopus androsaceus JB14 TaxID=1447944 RepID=A0A6A4GBN3_9AGAR|nr:hypothetical protein BT96DRAFT_1009840 [Gymnopus androsaceus JB14]